MNSLFEMVAKKSSITLCLDTTMEKSERRYSHLEHFDEAIKNEHQSHKKRKNFLLKYTVQIPSFKMNESMKKL